MTAAHFSAALSTLENTQEALGEALAALRRGMGNRVPDLALAFASPHHGPSRGELGPMLREATRARTVLGCMAQSVLAGGREPENRPGLALFAAKLPDTAIEPLRLGAVPGPSDTVLFTGMPDLGPAAETSVLLLVDPFHFPAEAFLERMNQDHPGVPVVGGLASAGHEAGQGVLFTGDGIEVEGAVGVALRGAMGIRPVVSQGCRPVGRPWVVTAARDNLLLKLGGRPAVDVLMETLGELPPDQRQLLQRGPFVGLALDATKSTFARGDFLVRGLLGIQPQERALAVGDHVRRGQTVQFLVRDGASAGEDLRQLLTEAGPAEGPQGALLFPCNGRGLRMFGVADHDSSVLLDVLGADTAVAGFAAAGELGPVDGTNFLHGFTASVALFRRQLGV